MRALSLTQPWATLVISGRKRIETRSWEIRYRGRVAIHASKGMPAWARDAALAFGYDPKLLSLGAVLGTVVITDCLPVQEVLDDITAFELSAGDYRIGRYAWILDDPLAFDQEYPAKGALGLWDWRAPEGIA